MTTVRHTAACMLEIHKTLVFLQKDIKMLRMSQRNVFNDPFTENESLLSDQLFRQKGIALNKLLLDFGRNKLCRFTSINILECCPIVFRYRRFGTMLTFVQI